MTELSLAAIVAVLAVVGYAVWRRRRAGRRPPAVEDKVANGVQEALPKPPPGVGERRSDQEFLAELLENLATMRSDYVRFAGRMLVAVGVVAVATFAALLVGGYAVRDAHSASVDAEAAAVAARAAARATAEVAEQNSRLIKRLDAVAAAAKREADRSTAALCALRADLQARVESSLDFLAEHPAGIPGVPVETIELGIRQTESTVKALKPLHCDRG